MILSECCDAHPWGEEEHGICGDCKEHCEFYDEEVVEVVPRVAFDAWLKQMEELREKN